MFWSQGAIICNKGLLDLCTFVTEKLPYDVSLVPKHVGAGTWYEVCFMIRFVLIQLVHFVGLKNGI